MYIHTPSSFCFQFACRSAWVLGEWFVSCGDFQTIETSKDTVVGDCISLGMNCHCPCLSSACFSSACLSSPLLSMQWITRIAELKLTHSCHPPLFTRGSPDRCIIAGFPHRGGKEISKSSVPSWLVNLKPPIGSKHLSPVPTNVPYLSSPSHPKYPKAPSTDSFRRHQKSIHTVGCCGVSNLTIVTCRN